MTPKKLLRLPFTLFTCLAFASYADWAIAQRLAAGGTHTCALISNLNVLKCWGRNNWGQLGNGGTTDSSVPVPVDLSLRLLSIQLSANTVVAGDDHSCALMSTEGVTCWGRNNNGQLGSGTTTDSSIPVTVNGLGTPVFAIAAGQGHTCVLLSSGAVRCWGGNGSGQLGNRSTTRSTVPVAVDLDGPAIGITAGEAHTCALMFADRTVRCWGQNNSGQLGNGTTTNSTVPVVVRNLAPAIALAAGARHTCALMAGGLVRCWGLNNNGQLGNERTASSSVPVAVVGLPTATAVAAGGNHTCALMAADGGVRCWGGNLFGELGNGTTTDSSVPVVVNNLRAATAIDVGLFHACALTSSGALRCWGHNWVGQLGDGSRTRSSVPVTVSKVSN
jgi:alpha-tubulin suppressor-like RCC1 family protein